MKLDHPTAQRIRGALSNSYIDVSNYAYDDEFLDTVLKKTNIFYKKEDRKRRSKSQVCEDTFYGELCERAFADLCIKAGLSAIHNVEEISQDFCWDINVEGALIEVKSQNGHTHFSLPTKCYASTHWKEYDLIAAFYIIDDKKKFIAVPWLLITNDAIGSRYYKLSNFNTEVVNNSYLQWGAEHENMLTRLNSDQELFTFK